MDISVQRNAYGAQIDSFETITILPNISPEPIPLIFIRAPYITRAGNDAEVLYRIEVIL